MDNLTNLFFKNRLSFPITIFFKQHVQASGLFNFVSASRDPCEIYPRNSYMTYFQIYFTVVDNKYNRDSRVFILFRIPYIIHS